MPKGENERLSFGPQAVRPFRPFDAPSSGRIDEADIAVDEPARHPAQPRIAYKAPQGHWSDGSRHALLHRGGVLLGKLHGVKAGIKPIARQQFSVPAGFYNLPTIQHANQVSGLDGREPMRDDERGASPN